MGVQEKPGSATHIRVAALMLPAPPQHLATRIWARSRGCSRQASSALLLPAVSTRRWVATDPVKVRGWLARWSAHHRAFCQRTICGPAAEGIIKQDLHGVADRQALTGNGEIVAFVQPLPGSCVRLTDLMEAMKPRVPCYIRPAKIVLVGVWPGSSTGKTREHELAGRLRAD